MTCDSWIVTCGRETEDTGPFEAQGKLKARRYKAKKTEDPPSKNEEGAPGPYKWLKWRDG